MEQARKRTTSRRELARNPRFEQISPDVGELDEAAVDEALARRSRRRCWRCSPTSPGRPTRGCASWPDALAGRLFLDLARRGPTKPRGIGSLGRAAVPARSAATSISTPAST